MVRTHLGKCEWVWEEKLRWLNPRWPNSRWQNSRWLPSSSWVRMNEWSIFCANGGEGNVSVVFFMQMVGTNPGKCEWDWEDKIRWLSPRWPNSRWLPSSSWVTMNEFESHWISLSQSQSGVRVFLSESERRKQGVWIQHGRIQDGCHHQVESEWMTEGFFVQMVGREVSVKSFLCKWWEPILASVSEFERKN